MIFPYDLASRQSKISFATQRERETALPSFGEKLKQEREKRKITLEQISVTTKIGTRMLQALEEDKFNQLPGGIFNKGFVRAYSRAVGLDEDQTVADYLQASGDAPPVSTEIAPREDHAQENAERVARLEASNETRRQLPWGLFAVGLLLIALALSFWNRRRQETTREPLRQSPIAAKSPVPAPSASSTLSTTTPSAEDTGKVPSNSEPPAPTQNSTAPNTSSAAAQSEFQVAIHVREQSWISTTIDGHEDVTETLDPGSERIFHGHKEITLKLGNSGGVDLRFDGKKIDIRGESGEVKTVTFGPQGIVANSP